MTSERRQSFSARSGPHRPRAPKTAEEPSSRRDASPSPAEYQERVAVFAHSGVEIVVRADQTILEAGLEAGVDLIFSCGLGGCGACMLNCLEGEVEYDDIDAICLLEQDIEEGLCLACVGRPRGRIVLDA